MGGVLMYGCSHDDREAGRPLKKVRFGFRNYGRVTKLRRTRYWATLDLALP